MVKSILDGANIQNCGDSNEIQPNELNTVCRPGFAGPRCEIIIDICLAQDPCENGGVCQSNGTSFVCNCPLHYSGDHCQYGMANKYANNSYVELCLLNTIVLYLQMHHWK